MNPDSELFGQDSDLDSDSKLETKNPDSDSRKKRVDSDSNPDSRHKLDIFRIGPDRAYPLHLTHPQLLLLSLLCVHPSTIAAAAFAFLLPFWALSFEIMTFQPLI